MQSEEDTTEHVLECNLGDTKLNLNDKKRKAWGEMVKIYRKNRSIDNIQEEQIKKTEDNRRRKKLREDRIGEEENTRKRNRRAK